MKNLLLAVRPKWCEKIASGQKTIEVRKSAPKEVPFKVYIYCTKGRDLLREISCWNTKTEIHTTNYKIINLDYCTNKIANGKVIGEFVCDRVYKWECKNRLEILESSPIWRASYMLFVDDLKKTCLTYDDLWDYGKGKPLYGWHISDLKIYDVPKELSEFKTPPCEKSEKACGNCKWLVKINTPDVYECECYVEDGRPITRPPQSYMFVEEL